MWWITTTLPNGPGPTGCARYASISSPPCPEMLIVPAINASLMRASLVLASSGPGPILPAAAGPSRAALQVARTAEYPHERRVYWRRPQFLREDLPKWNGRGEGHCHGT